MKKNISFALCMILFVMSACASSAPGTSDSTSTETAPRTEVATAAAGDTSPDTNASGLPIVTEPLTLTYWSIFPSKNAETRKSLGEVTAYMELEKRTGIKIDWQHPPIGQEKEQFNLMVASGDIPDLIYYGWQTAPGGPQK
ncbi:MAG: hypothetical protein LBS84_06610, partial [Clostridiales bacterium]|nr:hypothetical protein [Clostridiales bacterium]